MDISLDKKSNTSASIKISVKQEDYQQAYEKKLKDYSKQAQVKGFRPGKVPTGYIKKIYGTSILVDEINHLVGHKLQDYIRDNELRLLGDPLPNEEAAKNIDWDTQTDFDFVFDLGLVDDFTVAFDKVKLTRLAVEPDAKEVKETIENLREQHGETTNPEVSQSGDALMGKLTPEGSQEGEKGLLQLKKVDKKQEKPFIGVKEGDVVTFDIQKLFKEVSDLSDFVSKPEEEAKALKGKWQLHVEKVNRIEPAQLTEEFFTKVLGPDRAKTEEEFTTAVKEEMVKAYAREADQLLSYKLREALVEKTDIDMPDAFLVDWLSTGQDVTRQQAEENLEMYKKELRWNLIKSDIAKAEDIKVEPDEVRQRAMEQFVQQFGGQLTPEMSQQLLGFIDEYLQKDNGAQYQQISHQLLDDKVLTAAKDKVTVKDKKVKGQDFQKEAQKL